MYIIKKLEKLEHDADQFGFRWEKSQQIMDQIQSECNEIKVHLKEDHLHHAKDKLQEEIGDLLHAAFSLCIFCKFNPEETLQNSVTKFERRLKAVKQIATEKGLTSLDGLKFDELMNFWNQAKRSVG